MRSQLVLVERLQNAKHLVLVLLGFVGEFKGKEAVVVLQSPPLEVQFALWAGLERLLALLKVRLYRSFVDLFATIQRAHDDFRSAVVVSELVKGKILVLSAASFDRTAERMLVYQVCNDS